MCILAQVLVPLGRIVLLQAPFKIVRVSDIKAAF